MNHSNVPIDTKELLEIMDDDEDLLRECLDDFMQDYPDMLNKIKAAIDMGQCSDLEHAAHAFKGSLKYLAAREASEAANQLELMGKDNDLNNVQGVFLRLKEECLKIHTFIREY
ncbi:MAG: Hpt domain-containing protein [Proteobacteria bacterium]|nr:Hpt domain-containing protein [Pseudomonadota bacterium]